MISLPEPTANHDSLSLNFDKAMIHQGKIGARSKFERAMEKPLMHTTKDVSEMSFPCVRSEWADTLRGAHLTHGQMVRLVERIREAKSITQEDLGDATGRSRSNVSDILRNPEKRSKSLKEILSRLTGLECTETRYRVE